ncbi:hypothetical protein EJ02DRAFT_364702 [Clathrospora elynae]|uniref:Zn(2)-C6 fungal-type domain-containing protein n=1 Tax=Clathrospora elynae TaxID=706981 RepID=A0A6A5T788_9PLEO|nr:hypothetical protein EJ02DRAFT_364702 [Clathrospora elynae]
MVNVAGRSKGCSTCRRRRVKCDETRPTCQRCQRLGLVCDGPKDTAFVEAKIVKSRRTRKAAVTTTTVLARTQPTVSKRQEIEDSLSMSPDRQNSILEICPKFNEHEVYICHMRHQLLTNGPVDARIQDFQLAEITTDGSLFGQALLSSATTWFGIQYHQPNILTKGYVMHGAALRQLNLALRVPACQASDDVLLSVILLAMREMVEPSGPKNYLKHMLGLERLLELRDPTSLATCSTRTLDIYKGVRQMILLASLRNRVPSIFAKPEWKAVLRRGCLPKDSDEHDLLDVLADCSILTAATENCNGHTVWVLRQRDEIICKAVNLLIYLRTWKLRWDDDTSNSYAEDRISLSGYLVYRFRNDSVARMLMLYNTAFIHVLQILASTTLDTFNALRNSVQVQFALPRTYYDQSDVWTLISNGDYMAAERCAGLESARCIADYLDHKRARGGNDSTSPVVQWAYVTAWRALGGNESVEGMWMMRLLDGEDSQAIAKGVWEL